jgi:hypothetical protein
MKRGNAREKRKRDIRKIQGAMMITPLPTNQANQLINYPNPASQTKYDRYLSSKTKERCNVIQEIRKERKINQKETPDPFLTHLQKLYPPRLPYTPRKKSVKLFKISPSAKKGKKKKRKTQQNCHPIQTLNSESNVCCRPLGPRSKRDNQTCQGKELYIYYFLVHSAAATISTISTIFAISISTV